MLFSILLLSMVRSAFSQGETAHSASSLAPMLSCFGKQYQKIELDQSLASEKDQGGRGSCYGNSATASAEAAFFRQTGVRRPLRDYVAALASCVNSSTATDMITLKITDTIQGPLAGAMSARSPSVVDGGTIVPTLEKLLELGNMPWDDIAENSKWYDDMWSDFRINEAKAIAQMKMRIEEFKLKNDLVSKEARLENIVTQLSRPEMKTLEKGEKRAELVNEKIKIEEALEQANKDILQMAGNTSEVICEMGRCVLGDVTRGGDAITSRANLGSLKVDYPFLGRSGANSFDLVGSAPCNDEASKPNVNAIMQSLCAGVPMTIGIDMSMITQSDARPISPGGGHAMLITGAEVINGQPQFLVRNSWGNSDNAVSIPFNQACKGRELARLVNRNPVGGEKRSEAWIINNTRTYAPTLPESEEAQEIFKARSSGDKRWIKLTEVGAAMSPENLVGPHNGHETHAIDAPTAEVRPEE